MALNREKKSWAQGTFSLSSVQFGDLQEFYLTVACFQAGWLSPVTAGDGWGQNLSAPRRRFNFPAEPNSARRCRTTTRSSACFLADQTSHFSGFISQHKESFKATLTVGLFCYYRLQLYKNRGSWLVFLLFFSFLNFKCHSDLFWCNNVIGVTCKHCPTPYMCNNKGLEKQKQQQNMFYGFCFKFCSALSQTNSNSIFKTIKVNISR